MWAYYSGNNMHKPWRTQVNAVKCRVLCAACHERIIQIATAVHRTTNRRLKHLHKSNRKSDKYKLLRLTVVIMKKINSCSVEGTEAGTH